MRLDANPTNPLYFHFIVTIVACGVPVSYALRFWREWYHQFSTPVD